MPDLWKWTLASGLLAVILGILVLVGPGISILVAATLFAAYLPVSTLSPRFQHLHDTVECGHLTWPRFGRCSSRMLAPSGW